MTALLVLEYTRFSRVYRHNDEIDKNTTEAVSCDFFLILVVIVLSERSAAWSQELFHQLNLSVFT